MPLPQLRKFKRLRGIAMNPAMLDAFALAIVGGGVLTGDSYVSESDFSSAHCSILLGGK